MARNWTKQAIIFALRERGTTAAQIAKQAGLSRFTVYGGMERPSPKVHDIIAAALDTPRQTIWPQFYNGKGDRIGLINAGKAA